jgi:hypothetical protein
MKPSIPISLFDLNIPLKFHVCLLGFKKLLYKELIQRFPIALSIYNSPSSFCLHILYFSVYILVLNMFH